MGGGVIGVSCVSFPLLADPPWHAAIPLTNPILGKHHPNSSHLDGIGPVAPAAAQDKVRGARELPRPGLEVEVDGAQQRAVRLGDPQLGQARRPALPR